MEGQAKEFVKKSSDGAKVGPKVAASVQSLTSWREYMNENQKLYSRLVGIIFIVTAILLTRIIDPLGDEKESTPSSTKRPTGWKEWGEDAIILNMSYKLHTDLSYVAYHDAVLCRNLKTEIVVLVEDEGLIWTAFFFDSEDREMYHATLYVDGFFPEYYRYVFTVWPFRALITPDVLKIIIPFPKERLTRIKVLFEPHESMTMTVIDATSFASNEGVDHYFEGSTQDHELDRFAVGPREENPDHPFYTRRLETKTVEVPKTSFKQRFFYYRIILGSYLSNFKIPIGSLPPLSSFVGCVSSFYINDVIKLKTRYDKRNPDASKHDLEQCNRTIRDNFDVQIDEYEERR